MLARDEAAAIAGFVGGLVLIALARRLHRTR